MINFLLKLITLFEFFTVEKEKMFNYP